MGNYLNHANPGNFIRGPSDVAPYEGLNGLIFCEPGTVSRGTEGNSSVNLIMRAPHGP